MSTTSQLSENSHRGFDGIKAALCLASTEVKSNDASGMQLRLRRNGIGSRSSGKERDQETGLDYFLARYYSGAQGRFLSVDPGNASALEDDPQSWNAYAYSRNNPLKYIDPDGRLYLLTSGTSQLRFDDSYFRSWFYLDRRIKKSKGSTIGSGDVYYEGKWWHYEQLYEDDPDEIEQGLEPDHAANFAIGGIFSAGIKGGVSLLDMLFGTGAKQVSATVTEQIVVNGTKEAIRKALDKGVVDSAQKAAVKSALNRGAANAEYTLEKLADGSIKIITKRAGQNGYQAIEKVIDASGATKSVVQKAYNAAGKLVHDHVK